MLSDIMLWRPKASCPAILTAEDEQTWDAIAADVERIRAAGGIVEYGIPASEDDWDGTTWLGERPGGIPVREDD